MSIDYHWGSLRGTIAGGWEGMGEDSACEAVLLTHAPNERIIMFEVPSLVNLLVEAGFSDEGATRINDALDAIDSPGLEADNVASVLYKWRTKCVRARLKECRKKAAAIFVQDRDNNVQQIETVIAAFQATFETDEEFLPFTEGSYRQL